MNIAAVFHRAGRAAWLAGVLALAGCTSSASVSAAPVSTTDVTMPKSYRFSPQVIQVASGSTVTWHNEDNFTHSVHLLDGDGQDHVVKPGERTAITFTAPGTYRYECSFHPHDMHGRVIVIGTAATSPKGESPPAPTPAGYTKPNGY